MLVPEKDDESDKQLLNPEEHSPKEKPKTPISDFLSKMNLLSCFICRNQFNLAKRLPMMVCREQHTVCKSCLRNIKRTQYRDERTCPMCNKHFTYENVKKNRLLAEMV